MLESGGPGEPYHFVFWPVTEVWALGIGHYKMLVAQHQHQHQQHSFQYIQHQRL